MHPSQLESPLCVSQLLVPKLHSRLRGWSENTSPATRNHISRTNHAALVSVVKLRLQGKVAESYASVRVVLEYGRASAEQDCNML